MIKSSIISNFAIQNYALVSLIERFVKHKVPDSSSKPHVSPSILINAEQKIQYENNMK